MAAEWQALGRAAGRSTPAAARTFLPDGTAPVMGDSLRQPAPGRTASNCWRATARRRSTPARSRSHRRRHGARDGLLTAAGSRRPHRDWVETISTSYRGVDVHEMPPSTQGVVALEMLNILEGFDIAAHGPQLADYLHVVS